MRILYHHRTLGDGAEGIHIREMIAAFRSLGHQVKVIGPVGERPPPAPGKSGVLGRLKSRLPMPVFEFAEIAYTLYCFLQVTLELLRFRPDFIHDRYIAFNAGCVLAARLFRVPVVLEVNAPLALERSTEVDEKLRFVELAKRMERWICANADHTIVVSTPLKDYLESIGVPVGHCNVMPNGVDQKRFQPTARDPGLEETLGIAPGTFTIGFTGVLRPWHGLDLLMDAAAILNQRMGGFILLIVGDGPYRPILEERARSLGLVDKLRVSGRVSHDQVPRYISLFDVAVSPRATFYASPMKVIEYLALGKPVVVPSTQNFIDIIRDDGIGMTFESDDAESLCNAIYALLADSGLRDQIGARARQQVETRLNWIANAREVCEFMHIKPAATGR